jgi:KipI family sensor histidine kinase inhibitor
MLVKFDPLKIAHNELETILRSYLQRLDEVHLPEPRHVEIPVRYGGEEGPDLDEVAKVHGMTPDQVVELHGSPTYVVYFLGFVPGFAYLGGLPERLATPRLESPRRKVPAGSVGIGGNQTGIYPFETPGGWKLIGRTAVPIFQPGREDMCLFSIGDHVRFTAL